MRLPSPQKGKERALESEPLLPKDDVQVQIVPKLTEIVVEIEPPIPPVSNRFLVYSLLVGALLLVVGACILFLPGRHDPLLILISLDGFRYEYLKRGLTPTLTRLSSEGISASLSPSFPSVTFPNHYTLVTGMYPESHGIVGNVFYDPLRGSNFSYKSAEDARDPYWWSKAEPIWVSVIKEGKRAASIMWPGYRLLKFSYDISSNAKISQILEWVALPPHSRPDFIAAYFPEVDSQGHSGGVNSVNSTLGAIDLSISKLMDGLLQSGHPGVNVMIVSDHGMTDLSSKRIVIIDDYIDLKDVDILNDGPLVGLYPKKPSHVDSILSDLSKGASSGTFEVWKREDVPGWQVLTRVDSKLGSAKGSHGYDPQASDMQAIFIAHGSAFKRNMVVPSFENVQIYNIMSKVLKLPYRPTNGTESWFRDFSHFMTI